MATLAMLQVKLRDLKTPKSDFFTESWFYYPPYFLGFGVDSSMVFHVFCHLLFGLPRKVQLIWIAFDLILTSDLPEDSGK
jgi:hypothetical protein